MTQTVVEVLKIVAIAGGLCLTVSGVAGLLALGGTLMKYPPRGKEDARAYKTTFSRCALFLCSGLVLLAAQQLLALI